MPVPSARISVRISSLLSILSKRAFFDIEDFALEREDSLEFPIATLFGRTTGGISLDDEQLTQRRIFFGTVGQFAGQGSTIQSAFSPDEIFRFRAVPERARHRWPGC